MWEFDIINKDNEQRIIFGYSFKDACNRWGINPAEWTLIGSYYVD